MPLAPRESAQERLERLLSDDEKQRMEEFRFEHLRRRYIRTRGALRTILAGYCGKPPGELRFGTGRYGKPFLVNSSDTLAFNLSHCEDLAVIAVTAGKAVGVDVEKVRHMQNLDSILNRFFTAEELDFIHGAPGEQQPRAFFTLWTRREAAAKAQGLNLEAALTGIRIPVYAPGGSTSLSGLAGDESTGKKPAASWCIQDLELDPNHCGAVCAEGGKFVFFVKDFE
ncbi:MAG: 4'-phosphopantetheinyl transferase superfamily protein [Spirochaetales bacterium]|nr:4'-phosphopantetheinyl transferase superfamily protein [Spirochaetales bacterium]